MRSTRWKSLASVVLVATLVFGPSAQGTKAKSASVEFAADSERILEVALPGGIVSNLGVVVYPHDGRWFLPLGQLSQALGIAIEVWASGAGANGFVIDPDRTFRLDLLRCEAEVGRDTVRFPCEDARLFEQDIYLAETLVPKLLPIDVRVEPLRSQLLVTPREKLPFQAKIDRDQDTRNRLDRTAERPPYELAPVPPAYVGFTAIDQQLLASSAFPTSGGPYLNGISNVSGELVGMQALLTANYDERRVNVARLNLSRREREPFVLGLNLRDFQLWNLDVPTFPLIAPVRQGTGVLLSSFAPDAPSNFDKTDLQGPLQQGWEVLLYLNGVLIDRREGDASGLYRFNDIQLQYGENRFTLAFFGPSGERYERYQTFNIDRAARLPGQADYRVTAVNLSGNDQLLAGEFSLGVARELSVFAQGYAERLGGQRHLLFGAIGVGPGFSYATRFALSADGGRALEMGAITGYRSFSLNLKHTELWDFRSRLFNLDPNAPLQTNQSEVTAAAILPVGPGVGFRATGLRRAFADGSEEMLVRAQAMLNVRSVQIQTNVDYSPRALETFLGRTEVLWFPQRWRVRAALDYDPRALRGAELELQYVRPDWWQGGIKIVQPFDGSSRVYEARLTRLFPTLALGVFGTAGLVESAGIQANFSLARDPRTGSMTMGATPVATTGFVSVLAFLDENDNGRRDANERVLPEMGFSLCGNADRYTDEYGALLQANLPARARCDVVATEGREASPFLRPAKPGVTVFPREGVVAKIDYPFRAVGQIDGYVTGVDARNQSAARRGIVLELSDAKTQTVVARTRSDSYGFYAFEQVRAGGQYRVRVVGTGDPDARLSAAPSERLVTLPPEGEFVSEVNFAVR